MIQDTEYTEADRKFMNGMMRQAKTERGSELCIWAVLALGTAFWIWLVFLAVPWLHGFYEIAQVWARRFGL